MTKLEGTLKMEKAKAHINPPKTYINSISRPIGRSKKSKELVQPILQQVEDEEVENGASKEKHCGYHTN